MNTDTSAGILDRVAAAPISWGVCEVPGWGWQFDPATVLAQMRDVGVKATEFGPDGFLPADPTDKAAVLRDNGIAAVGGFVPVVLHDPGHDPLPQVRRELEGFLAAGAATMVLAAATGRDGYDTRPGLDAVGWDRLVSTLDAIAAVTAERGVLATLHPHVGTMVESEDDVHRVLDGAGIGLCLDTGHLMIGGTDPAALVRDVPERIAHTHLKDVDASWAERVRRGDVTYTDAVRDGLYRPLGDGDVGIRGIVTDLEARGYHGWYVLEQDTVLTGPPVDDGPVQDVRRSLAHLATIAGSLSAPEPTHQGRRP